MSEARRIRLLAIGLLGGFAVFGAALISIPLLIREPLPVVRPNSAISFSLGEAHAVGRLQVNQAGAFVLDLGLPRDDTLRPNSPVIEFTHQQGARLAPTTATVAAGHFRVAGRLDLPGQWRIQLGGNPDRSFKFILAEW